MKININPAEVKKNVKLKLERGMTRAAMHVESKVVESISTGQEESIEAARSAACVNGQVATIDHTRS